MSEYQTTFNGGYFVTVDKVGGGTPPKAYEGDWIVSVRSGVVFLLDNALISTPAWPKKTHAQVARLARDWAEDEDDR